MQSLVAYLKDQVPEGMSYQDAAQLCLRLYCTVEGVPKHLLPLSKEVLADAFAELARLGWVRDEARLYSAIYGANFHQVTDKGHWVEVIASMFKTGPEVCDMERGAALARQAGFGKGRGSP